MKKVEILKDGPVCIDQTGPVRNLKGGDLVEVTDSCAKVLVKNCARYWDEHTGDPVKKSEKIEPENKMEKDSPQNKSSDKKVQKSKSKGD